MSMAAKRISLIEDWRRVLKKAWSVRWMIVAGLLSGVEIVLPLFSDSFPRHIFAAMSFFAVFAALVSRFVAQKSMNDDHQ
jgi:hypothetical protein